VPEEKIAPRYKRTMNQLLKACLLVDRAYLFDNSLESYALIAEIHHGELTVHTDNLVDQFSWFKKHLIDKFHQD
jgi:predicted ABC-type ATPase